LTNRRSQRLSATYQPYRSAPSIAWDPFAVNPIGRSLATFVISTIAVIVPIALFSPRLEALTMISFGWAAIIGMVFSLPVLLISLCEALWNAVSRRIYPSIDLLDLSPRVRNLLRRYGYTSIDSVDQTSDDALLMLTNFDPLAVHELRRAISIWKYLRWQDAGFPANSRW
jgi:hypothetical protein